MRYDARMTILLLLALVQDAPGIRDPRPLTSGGTHAEAYFNHDGTKLVLMGQRPGDGADQIYVLDLPSGRLERASSGEGKTTCGWFLPDGRLVYSSTHHHGAAPPPRPDRSQGYVWPFFRTFDLFLKEKDGALRQLTAVDGYDAETTASADGKTLVFTSQRDGEMALYTMSPDASNLRRVTKRRGYPGGAVFSPDGTKLVYRAFYPKTPDEEAALDRLLKERLLEPRKCHFEIFVSDVDGSNERPLTSFGKASWAPCWHPDGKTLVFASDKDATRPGQFSLYAMDADGADVRRLTDHDGFDSFPHFSPDGTKIVFISNRGGADPRRDLNVFIADWR